MVYTARNVSGFLLCSVLLIGLARCQEEPIPVPTWSAAEKSAVVKAMKYHGTLTSWNEIRNGNRNYYFEREGKTCKLLTWRLKDGKASDRVRQTGR